MTSEAYLAERMERFADFLDTLSMKDENLAAWASWCRNDIGPVGHREHPQRRPRARLKASGALPHGPELWRRSLCKGPRSEEPRVQL